MTTHDFARHRAWRWILLVTLLMALGALWACASNGGDDDDDAAEETDDDDDDTEEEFDPNHFTLGAPGTGDEEPTGRLIGWNIGRGTYYAASDDPFHGDGSEFGDWNTPSREAAMQSFSLLRPGTGETPYMRFSGLQIDGNLGADGYHFWNFVDPDRVAADTDNMAVFNYMDFIDKSDCLPTVTLNFGSGTAAEAGDYAQYLNGTGVNKYVLARKNWGPDSPYNQKIFEIGNEVYGAWNTGYGAGSVYPYSYANPDAVNGGDPDWYNKPSKNAANFAARALEYIDEVQKVTPDAEFWVPLSQATMDAWGGLTSAINDLNPLLTDPAVTAVVIHHYKVDDLKNLGWDGKNDPRLLIAGAEPFHAKFQQLKSALAAIPRETPLKVAVTEYHTAGAFSSFEFDREDQPIVGLGIADMLILYAQEDVDIAMQHMAVLFESTSELLFEKWYNPFRYIDSKLVEMPSFVVTKLIANHLLERRADLRTEQAQETTVSVNSVSFTYPILTAVAFHAADGGESTIIVLNRDLESEREFTVDLPADPQAESGSIYAPSTYEENASFSKPGIKSWNGFEVNGTRLTATIPPHSVAAIRLTWP